MSRLYSWAVGLLFVLLVLVVFALGWSARGEHEQSKAGQALRDQLSKAFEQGQALGTVRDNVVTEYVDRIQVIKERGATIIKEVPVYVSAQADAACTVNAGFVRVHDASARSLPAPDPAGDADAAPSGVALSTVAATTAENYTRCNVNAERLTKLQSLLQQYQSVAAKGGQAPP
ncbi:hypothetical protein LOY64_30135 (plasmid) [Pseudomonas corrugata]|uniref:hypothetical protein n=1 Tax=Pseudomonas corrugata TaxID=47879 RepID=UPI00222E79AF|nr:hypothetical protein [Pseudomonas corrugata]UZD98466.1 hypothetical protein LOY64_30260 [Pseudomonas corrugata]UZD98529.1 hypothetical protein LOY64_30135 [Pseudomonas corrugata]